VTAASSACTVNTSVGRANGDFVVRVRGDSMEPVLLDGDELVLRSVDGSALHRGDIVLVSRGGSLVAHRLVQWDRGRGRTKGDNRVHSEDVDCADCVLGKAVAVARSGRVYLIDGRSWAIVNRALGWWGFLESRRHGIQRALHLRDGCRARNLLRATAAPARVAFRVPYALAARLLLDDAPIPTGDDGQRC